LLENGEVYVYRFSIRMDLFNEFNGLNIWILDGLYSMGSMELYFVFNIILIRMNRIHPYIK
jgi:hypothetical protein